MNETRAPKGGEWGLVIDALHALATTITVRSHYTEGHPAIAHADQSAAATFTRVLEAIPEVVVALVDGEFVICERPLPDLRTRLHSLADAMVRHEIECIVFQHGMPPEEAAILGLALAGPADVKGRVRERTQAALSRVLLRFVVRAGDSAAGGGATGSYFVPPVRDMLLGVARDLAAESPIDKLGIGAIANQIVIAVVARSAMITQRAWSRTIDDEAAHAANVAIMAATLAADEGYPQRTVIDVAAAALVHDIGHLFLPPELRGLPEPLVEERARPVFRNHTFAGAAMLLGAGCAPLWVAGALEHHRGVDRGGYPTLESTEAPHELVRMISLANYFDRKRTLLAGRADDPEQILRAAMALEERYFGKGMVARFVRSLGVYPPGTTVELTSREPAIVTRANAADPWRPQVQLLRGQSAGRRVELRELSEKEVRHGLSIVRAIAPPLIVLADVAAAALAVELPEVPAEAGDRAPVVVELSKLVARAADGGARSATDVARAQLGGMDALLDALGTVPAEAILSAMPPPPSGFPRAPRSIPPIVTPPRASVRAPAPVTTPPAPAPRDHESALLERIGPLTAVPVVIADVTKAKLDHRAAFVLRFLDGMSSIEDILDASGVSRVETLGILDALLTANVIKIR